MTKNVKSLYDAITNGDLKSGEKLPSQEKIAEVYQVSIGTVIEAITSLVHEGLLDGSGFLTQKLI